MPKFSHFKSQINIKKILFLANIIYMFNLYFKLTKSLNSNIFIINLKITFIYNIHL